jgi:CsoR family transcriptional regulator, copper-sensing transcriptional repressor
VSPADEHEPGYAAEGDAEALLKRLRRIEGQVRGVHRMVEEEAYCVDVLTQVTAIKRALEKVSLLLVEDHLRGCVLEAAKAGEPAEAEHHLASATEAINRLLRS